MYVCMYIYIYIYNMWTCKALKLAAVLIIFIYFMWLFCHIIVLKIVNNAQYLHIAIFVICFTFQHNPGGTRPPLIFYDINVFHTVALCQPHAKIPIWRTRVSLVFWVNTFYLSGMVRHYQELRYHRHSTQGHLTTQTQPLHQSEDTFSGDTLK